MMDVKIENLAFKQDIRDRVCTELDTFIQSVVDNRRPLEYDWERFINMYNQKDDGTAGYRGGRANAYIPELKKAVRSSMANAKRTIFPIGKDPQINCEPEVPLKDQEIAKRAVKALQLYDLGRARFDLVVENSLLEYYLLGNGIVKGGWHKKSGYRLEKTKSKKMIEKEVTFFEGPKPVFRSIFNVYFWPEYVTTVEDAEIVIERMQVSYADIAEKVRKKIYPKNVLEYIDSRKSDVREGFDARTRLEFNQGLNPVDEIAPEEDGQYTVYQIWKEMDFGKGRRSYLIEKMKNGGAETVLRVIRNPMPDQKHPYKHAGLFPSPVSTIYHQGIGHSVDKLQYLLNDVVNQTMDSVTFLNNPVVNVDLGLIQMNPDDLEFAPGTIVYGNKEAYNPVVLGDPGLPGVGFNAMAVLRDIIKDHTTDPSMPASLEGKARSASQANIVGAIAQVELIDPVKKFENSVLVPILQHNHMLRAFNYDEDKYIKILSDKIVGYENAVTKKEDFVSDYIWKWAGAEAAQNEQVRTMQLINFVNTISRMPPEVQQAMKINYSTLVLKVWTEGFGFKDDGSIIQDTARSVDPEVENRMVKNGLDIMVNVADDDDYHIYRHQSGENLDELNEDGLVAMVEHVKLHQAQKQQKQSQAEAMANAQAQMAMMQGQQGGGEAPSGMGNGYARSGNQAQLKQASNDSDMTRGMRL